MKISYDLSVLVFGDDSFQIDRNSCEDRLYESTGMSSSNSCKKSKGCILIISSGIGENAISGNSGVYMHFRQITC